MKFAEPLLNNAFHIHSLIFLAWISTSVATEHDPTGHPWEWSL